jgi:hypothetical protein
VRRDRRADAEAPVLFQLTTRRSALLLTDWFFLEIGIWPLAFKLSNRYAQCVFAFEVYRTVHGAVSSYVNFGARTVWVKRG